jgi:hypothetical protein
VAGKSHLGKCDEETTIAAIVIGQKLLYTDKLLDGVKEGFEFGGRRSVGAVVAGLSIDLCEAGSA